ncbi:MAG: GNAT family N-acetyltransferase [Bacteroidaceae bacterium]
MQTTIRRAEENDIPRLAELLLQVAAIHHAGRPDLFRPASRKYTDDELRSILADEQTPVFVAVDEADTVQGYAFCVFQRPRSGHVLTDVLTLYIDDLCVDEHCRGNHVGRSLYQAVVAFARRQGCYNVTLNVWSCNESALRFYERMGLRPQKISMELVL